MLTTLPPKRKIFFVKKKFFFSRKGKKRKLNEGNTLNESYDGKIQFDPNQGNLLLGWLPYHSATILPLKAS